MKENNQQKTRRGRKPLGDETRQVIKITLPPSQIQALLRLLKITGESVSNFTERAIKEAIYKEMLDASRFAADLLKKDTALKPEPKRIPAPIQFQEPTPLPTNIIEIPLFGSVAAGTPSGPLDVADGTHPVPRDLLGKHKPADLYVLRINGESMQPEYRDGRFILCRKLRDGEYAKKGQDVIANDANGAYFKRLEYRKEGKIGDTPRKAVPRLVSINPDYPEVLPVADCPIVAVVISKL